MNKICNKDHSYNGWKNYETWSIALFIDNNECYQNEVQELVNDSKIEYYDRLCNLKDFVEENFLTYSLMNEQKQMIQVFINEVDFDELMKHYIEVKNEN